MSKNRLKAGLQLGAGGAGDGLFAEPLAGGEAKVAVEVARQLLGMICWNPALRKFGNAAPFETRRMKQFRG